MVNAVDSERGLLQQKQIQRNEEQSLQTSILCISLSLSLSNSNYIFYFLQRTCPWTPVVVLLPLAIYVEHPHPWLLAIIHMTHLQHQRKLNLYITSKLDRVYHPIQHTTDLTSP